MKVLVLHAYSRENAGDGLLVDATLDLVREAFGADVEVTVAASRPDSFRAAGIAAVGSRPSLRGYDRDYRRVLADPGAFDVLVGVGGGYLRAGRPRELVTAALVHGPQLWTAAARRGPVVYLPQSVGPLRFGTRRAVVRRLGRVGELMVRDDRSLREVADARPVRCPDLALSTGAFVPHHDQRVDPVPVVSVRAVHGRVPAAVRRLARDVGIHDGYVQSRVGANDDTAATAQTAPRRVLAADELMDAGAGPRRVVVAMRLHAALMALQAGHLVVHLAYERKGFGAFHDLGLPEYVHNAFRCDPHEVRRQLGRLTADADARRRYDDAVAAGSDAARQDRARIVARLRASVAEAHAR
ncbi:polysaccharide pyruvyl transferase family protein [Cellulomonas sp. URHB0016]